MRACLLQRIAYITQRTTMMILALLTLLLITNGSAVETNATGIVGQNVILPCGCSSVSSLVWQKDERVVNGYPQERESIDQAYIDRTELFVEKEKTNCSLMILNISSADAGVYTCHALFHVSGKAWSKKSLEVNLTVSEKEDGGQETSGYKTDNTDNTVSISVPILVVLILAVALVLLTLLIKRRQRTNNTTDTDLPSQQPMIKTV